MLVQGQRHDQTRERLANQQPQPPANSNPIYSSNPGTTPGQNPANSGITDAAEGTKDGVLIREGVEKLNGAGDSAYLRITPEVKAQGNLRGVMVGAKGQLGGDMRVTQNGEGPDATYTLRYDKQSLGAITGEVGTDTLGKGAGGKNSVNGRVKAEVGGQTFDAVEMTFDNKEDAIRAAETLQKLHMADALDDGINTAISGLGPMGMPLAAAEDVISGGGENPLGNPLNADGAPGRLTQKIAGVTDDDLAFLRDNISAYETTIGTRGRLAAEVKGDMKYFNVAGEGRFDDTKRISRRVELPTADKDGSVTYSMEAGLRLTAKEKAQKGFQVNGLPVEPKFENRLDLGNASAKVSLTYTIPKGTEVAGSAGGRPVPETNGFSGTDGLKLDSVSLTNVLEYRDQSLADPSRGDSQRLTSTTTIANPEKLGDAAGQFFDGNFEEAARIAGARIDLKSEDIARSGTATQTGAKVKLGVAEAEASVILESGVDDVTLQASRTIEPSQPQPGQQPTTETRIPPAPADDGKTLVVTPWNGANIRTAPDGDGAGIAQNGTFLRDQGERQTGADGQEWIKVSGTDLNDAPVQGWVRADLVQPHSSAKGAMDETGRTNPSLEHERYDAVTVEKDDNLWDLAQKHGVDPQEMVALNRDHLLNPSLIFKGDTVYLPGTARGPKPEVVEIPAEPAPPANSDDSTSNPAPSTPAPGTGSHPPANDDSAPKAGNPPEAPKTDPAPVQPPATDGRPDLNQILQDYQVKDDQMTEYKPNIGPLPIDAPFVGSTKMTQAEADLLDKLGSNRGILGLNDFKGISSNDANDLGQSYRTANEYFPRNAADGSPIPGAEDGHNDAFRHAYWSALMSDRFGEEFSAAMGTAHEGVPGNPAAKEAMDLYNNEVGRRIARENPDADDKQLADKVAEAVRNGEMLVIGSDGNLAWSDQVEYGKNGDANATTTLPGKQTPPEYKSS
ncbi:DUF6973 domain-containing protein [Paracoccus laeviglucosivorans]|uniref:LysM domain-containing protein n=1 Tax=Paracoccus laeviglucosivorans TaxID=1197861 RepID=A0A521BF98_9RHOB|nr:LysM peptidoglycan-binding domain-containing protein [Paracoccus laeviglucosivorans]SMO45749.1 LysM domain-containing protein [Paracoccus laeviglucosivorans]